MSEQGTTPSRRLGPYLRWLRTSSWDVSVTQGQLAKALDVSSALVSSWEAENAVPPTERLKQYARFFATRRTLTGRTAKLVPIDDMDDAERGERDRLEEALLGLGKVARDDSGTTQQEKGALGGTFWHFPDGQAVTILCTGLSMRQLLGDRAGERSREQIAEELDDSYTPAQTYTLNPTHPNAIYNFQNGDVDALIELVGHIRAENPSTDVKWMTPDRIRIADDMTGHIVILGGGDGLNDDVDYGAVTYLQRSLEIPVRTEEQVESSEFDLIFTVAEDDEGRPARDGDHRVKYAPGFLVEEGRRRLLGGAPVLVHDLALIARLPNPLNASATVTMCSGLFSRGTYGAARTFTDPNLRSRNERFLAELVDPEDFWMLVQVPVLAGERTITPDLGRSAHRLRMSS